jgi:uncharacterized membrane protein HdeD (DUF308 family)
MNILKNMRKTLITSAAFYIVLGIIMIIFPAFINDFFSTIVGVLILLFGVSQLAIYTSKSGYGGMVKITLGLGVIGTLAGVYILLNPKFITSIIPLISGLIIIINALNKVKQSAELKASNYDKWWYTLVSALVLLTLGFILMANPFAAVEVIIRTLGIILIVEGIYDIVTVASYSSEVNRVVKTIRK